MLRILPGTLMLCAFALALLADPAAAAAYRDMSRNVLAPAQPMALQGPLALSVIYPGVVVLMTMAAFYFLKVMEPHVEHDHPAFIRGSIALSAIWLLGFYPFLASALGGLFFCVTSVACTGAWFILRRFGVQARLWQTGMVFWAFFFFSLVAAAIATGNGPGIARFMERAMPDAHMAARALGPYLLIAVNAGAFWLGLRIIGWRMPRPGTPEGVIRLKVLSLAAFILLFDVVALESRYLSFGWLPFLMLALPSLAYYGVYWLVMRLPPPLRARVSGVLFVLLALFLVLLACLSAGAGGLALMLSAALLGLALSGGTALARLARSGVAQAAKAAAFILAAAALLAAAYVAKTLAMLTPAQAAPLVRDELLPVLLSWQALAALLALYGAGTRFTLSQARAKADRYLLGCAMVFLLLLGHIGAEYAKPAAQGHHENLRLGKPAAIPAQERLKRGRSGEWEWHRNQTDAPGPRENRYRHDPWR